MYQAWVFFFLRVPHKLLGIRALRICIYRAVHLARKGQEFFSVTVSQASWQSGFWEGMLRCWKQSLLGFCISSGVNQAIPLEWFHILQVTFFPEVNTVKKLIINSKINLFGFDYDLLC